MEYKTIIAETERLILRRYKKEDIQDLFEYLSDPEVVEYEPYKPLTLEEAAENLEWRIGTEEMIAVELKSSRKMIGNVYMGKREFEALEIGYVFNRNLSFFVLKNLEISGISACETLKPYVLSLVFSLTG